MEIQTEKKSVIHDLHPLAKLLTTVAYIVITVSLDKYDISGTVVMGLYPLFMFEASGSSVKICLHKLRFVLPLVIMAGILNPFLDKTAFPLGGIIMRGGIISFFTLLLKGIFCLMSSYLFAATTSIDELCAAFRKLRFPKLFVTLILLTWRYISVMMEEVSVMNEAYHLRAPGQKGIHFSAWGSFLGQLFLRSVDRAEELYTSMLLRGFTGNFYYAVHRKSRLKDWIFTFVCIGLFLSIPYFHVAELIGKLIVGGN